VTTVRIQTVELEPVRELGPEPVLRAAVYEARLHALRARMERGGLDALLVYADREHYANVAYLVGFDPRFEEALLLLRSAGDPVVLAGNESLSFCERAGVAVRGVLCQSFSLPSQDRSQRRRLANALGEAGLRRAERVGLVGWKPIPRDDAPAGRWALAIPQFVLSEIEAYLDEPPVDATLELCGLGGLRAVNEADQLALHEHRAARASHCVWRAIEALRPGITELEVSRAMGLVGLPLSCHVMCTSGAASVHGLSSPTDREIAEGDRFSTAVGYWGGLCCRAGLILESADTRLDAYVERFAAPYYAAVREWYGSVRIGATAGEVSSRVRARLEPTAVRAMLDAGHLISLDEWFDSPFAPESTVPLRSGTALQCDIIPISDRHPGDTANVEDSLALADGDLHAEIAQRFPAAWSRIAGRRRFMTDVLGLELADELLPFSDRQAAFAPGLLSPANVLVS
jgi:hypothetical protein